MHASSMGKLVLSPHVHPDTLTGECLCSEAGLRLGGGGMKMGQPRLFQNMPASSMG